MKRVLIILFGAIGDVTQALPLAVRLKKHEPETHISWVVEPPSKSLLVGHPAVDQVILFDRPRGLTAYRECLTELRKQEYDVVLDLQRHVKSGFTSWMSRGKTRIGFHRRNAKEFNWVFNNTHVPAQEKFLPKIEHYQKFLDLLAVPRMEPLEYQLQASEEESRRVRELLARKLEEKGLERKRGLVALVIGASWESKVWPLSNYALLIPRLYEEENLVPVIVGGRAELAAAEELTKAKNLPAIHVVGETSLRELCAVFAECEFAIGSDSGPAHIAAASGKKVLTFWGPTSARRSAPYGSEALVLQSAIGCSPCYRRRCPGLGTICMRDIPEEAVMLLLRGLDAREQ